jgi:DNA-binding CsgD family transcriptional regulator
MALEPSQAFSKDWDRRHRKSGPREEEQADFSVEELAYIAQALLAILKSGSAIEVLNRILTTETGLVHIHGCALYCSKDGAGLRLAYGAGDCKSYLPDLIPNGSDLYRTITEEHFAQHSSPSIQRSLFDEPQSLFCPIFVDHELDSAIAIIYDPCDTHCLRAIQSNAANVISLSCRSDVGFKCNSCALSRECYGTEPSVGHQSASDQTDGLFTSREREILPLMAQGLSNKDIANRLFISPATCKHHVMNIFAKLGVHSRAAAVNAWLSLLDASEQNS